MRVKMCYVSWAFLWAVIVSIGIPCAHTGKAEGYSKVGILVVGHGYFSQNPKFFALVDEVQRRMPDYHVDQGLHMVMDMNTGLMMQTEDEAIRRLEAKGAEKVIVVPLYLNTNSSTVQVIKWSIGCKVEGKPDKSDYLGEIIDCPGEHDPQNDLCLHMMAVHRRFHSFSNMAHIATDAIDYHPDISTVLLERALEFSTDPSNEVVLLVGHGDGDDAVDQDYRDTVLAKYASDVKGAGGFFDVQYGTIREDWCDKRIAAVQDIRDKITVAVNEGHKVIWVEVRIASWSNAHAQEWDPPVCNKLGTKDFLDAGMYTRANFLLSNPTSLAEWVISMANEAENNNQYVDCVTGK